jgi:hypothetical protein
VVPANLFALAGAELQAWVRLWTAALEAARPGPAFPPRRRFQATLEALEDGVETGLYDGAWMDPRTGLPGLASFVRIAADGEVACSADVAIDGRRAAYHARLRRVVPAAVDEHGVELLAEDPEEDSVRVRATTTKLLGSGVYARVVAELVGPRAALAVGARDGPPRLREELAAVLYRYASFDAEVLFARLSEHAGLRVDRVERGSFGSLAFTMPGSTVTYGSLPAPLDPVWRRTIAGAPERWHAVASFGIDAAARDIPEDRDHDPFTGLLGEGVAPERRAEFADLRGRLGYHAYKGRRLVASPAVATQLEPVLATADGAMLFVLPADLELTARRPHAT